MNILNYEKIKEHKKQADMMFPTLYTVSHRVKGLILPHHWHSELEFIYLSRGEAIFTIDEKEVLVKAGEGIFINAGQIHSGVSITDTCDYFSVVFNTNYLSNSFDVCNKFFEGITTNKYNLIQHFTMDNSQESDVILELEVIIEELQNKSIGYELSVKSKLLYIFSLIFRHSLYTTTLSTKIRLFEVKKYNKLKQILKYIYLNYNKKFLLPDISTAVNLTPQYLCKFFKEMTDMNIVDYTNHYRIETASYLLKVSDQSITDIAIECGFDNISYFNRVFKKHIGCTPTEYRLKSLSYETNSCCLL